MGEMGGGTKAFPRGSKKRKDLPPKHVQVIIDRQGRKGDLFEAKRNNGRKG